jgi:type II secretory pathway pseudopilin PulG
MQEHALRRHGRRQRGNRGGFTLAELALAMTMLIVALVSISAATLRTHSLRRQNRERTLANTAIRSIAERIHALAYVTAEQNPGNWAPSILAVYGPGGTIGSTFDVIELNPTNAGGQVGLINIITDETTTDAIEGTELGLPRDLNGDQDALDVDVSADARILPVVVSVTYTGQTGAVTITHTFLIVGF